LISQRIASTILAVDSPGCSEPTVPERLSLLLRSALYGLRGGFLVRSLIIALAFGATGAILSFAEEREPRLSAWIPEVLLASKNVPESL
jgi:hypothetical protein